MTVIQIGLRRVDFLVEKNVLVELKAIIKIEDVHLAQGLNYLVAYKLDKGLLINFGAKSLEIKRLRQPNKQTQIIGLKDFGLFFRLIQIQQSINPINPNPIIH